MPTIREILDIDYIKKHTPNLSNLKVSLKKSKIKGVSLFANRDIKKGEIMAYYKISVYSNQNFKSKTGNMYTIAVNTKNNNYSRSLIGDLSPLSLEKPRGDIPFWGYFSNEPSGSQEINCYIDTNLKENYKYKSRMSPGDTMIYKLRALRQIKKGEEITWCYGPDYNRDYEPNC